MAKSRQDRYEDDDIKSGPSSMKEHDRNEEVGDYEVHTKQDAPPRFSTIFDTKPVPTPVEHFIEAPRRRERGGVFITWPILALLIIIFLFETIIIFAYTSIGLYNQLSGFTGRSQTLAGHVGTSACDLAPQNQAAAPINISPNIIIGAVDHPAAVTQTVTLPGMLPFPMQLPTSISTSRSLSSSSSTTSSSSSSTTSSSSTASIPVVTVTPGGIATSVVFVTAGAESKTDVTAPTTFVTVVAGQSTTSSSSSSSPTTAAAEATKNVITPSSLSSTSTSTPSTSTTPTTATTPSSSSSSIATSTTATTEAHGTNAAFIGGLGGTGGH